MPSTEASRSTMETTTTNGKKAPSLPPALYLVRARSWTSKVLDLDSASSGPPTPPLRPPVAVPFLWEVAPGKPRLMESEEPSAAPAATGPLPAGGGDHDGSARPRPATLKLPPRLQAAAAMTKEFSLSPNTVLHGPYGANKKPPRTLRRSGSTATESFRRRPAAGGRLFSWRKATVSKKDGHDHDSARPDASCCSPAGSSASSSSSSSSSLSLSYFGDEQRSSGAHRRRDDGGEDPDDVEEGAQRSVRITRLRSNRSLPNMTASYLWASIRKSVRQITPWS